MKRNVVLMLLACLLFLAGCGTTPSATDTLQVTRFSAVLASNYSPLARTITDASKVQELYHTIQALSPAAQIPFCPLDLGLRYRLSFSLNNVPMSLVIMSGDGCRYVTLGKNDMRGPSQAFWSQLAKALGISEAELFVKPLNN